MNSPPTAPGVREALRAIEAGGIRCVSFDFFDTLAVRRCERPSDLFIELGRRLDKAGLLTGLPGLDAEEFRGLRRHAERMARAKARAAGREGEVRLPEVYDILLKDAKPEERQRAIEIEIETEQDYLIFCPAAESLLDACRAQSIPWVVTSDIYFSSAQLQRLIDSINEKLEPARRLKPDQVFTSADFDTSKHFDLFSRVLEKLNLEKSQLLHTGDNHAADVVRPRTLGIKSFYLERYRAEQDETLALETRHRPVMPADDYYIRAARSLADLDGGDAARSFGAFVLGPVYTGFVFQLLSHLREGRADGLVFLTREGVFLKELTEIAAGSSIDADDRLKLLHVSRAAMKAASPGHDEYDPEQGKLFMEYFKGIAGGAKRPLLVDVGWQGRMQALISEAMRAAGEKAELSGAYLMMGGRYREIALEKGLRISSFLPVSAQDDGFREAIYRAPLMFELAAMPSFGTTTGYRRGENGVEPVLTPLEKNMFPLEIGRMQQGTRDFLRTYLSLVGGAPREPEAVREFANQARAIVSRAVLRPSRRETEIWRDVRQEESVGDVRPFLDLARKARYSGLTFEQIRYHRDLFWPAAMIQAMDPAKADAFENYELSDLGGRERVRARWTLLGRFNYIRRGLFGVTAREKLGRLLKGAARRVPLLKRLGSGLRSLSRR